MIPVHNIKGVLSTFNFVDESFRRLELLLISTLHISVYEVNVLDVSKRYYC